LNAKQETRPSLQVIRNGEVIYETTGKWLYPLFDLEDSLKDHPIDLKTATIRDKIVGKAAAMLILRLGAVRVHGDVMSELAVKVFEDAVIPHSFDELVPRIDCKTEELLKDIHDLEEAYAILCKRAGRC
jgi:zinc transport system ATP-binding protein